MRGKYFVKEVFTRLSSSLCCYDYDNITLAVILYQVFLSITNDFQIDLILPIDGITVEMPFFCQIDHQVRMDIEVIAVSLQSTSFKYLIITIMVLSQQLRPQVTGDKRNLYTVIENYVFLSMIKIFQKISNL